MSQQRQFQMVVGGNNVGGGGGGGGQQHQQFIDTTYTKIFVGGLAWETQRDTMRRYFEQFGEIQEAVVITDKNTGRSKGYGFVTFKDPDSASRACQDPSPVIDGRRANCNLASLGAQRNHPTFHQHGGMGRFRPGPGSVAPPTYQGSSSAAAYFHQPTQYTFPYSAAYGYSGYSQENMYPLNYYNVYGGQQVSAYYTAASAAGAPAAGIYPNYYPFYAQYAQSNQTQGVRIQYPSMVQYPYLPQHYATPAILSIPTSVSPAAVATGVMGSISIEGSAPTGSITIKDPGGITKQSSSA